MKMKTSLPSPEKPWSSISVVIAALLAGVLLVSAFIQYGDRSLLCPHTTTTTTTTHNANYKLPVQQLRAIIHYATSTITPQQNNEEIAVSFPVLLSRAPCNFLVFGLGYDSVMWAALNPGGSTLFLEEDPEWVEKMQAKNTSSGLNAHAVNYRTQLKEADWLLQTYRTEPTCSPASTFLRGNSRCRLALDNLPKEVYEKEWDLIMIDAPRGYFDAAPGRMGAIYSAAVMARSRKSPGLTDVFLHDVDRKVEREFAQEFLCDKYRVGAAGRLWHFRIPPHHIMIGDKFC